MLCPKCDYNSFDYNENCPKCGKDIRPIRKLLPAESPKPEAVDFFAFLENGKALDGNSGFPYDPSDRS
jgi:hypothetical protein